MRRFRAAPPVGRVRSVVIGPTESERRMLLGRLSEAGPQKEIWLDVDKEHVIAVLGKRGSGKTHTLGVLVEGLGFDDPTGRLSKDSTDRAVLVFDTLNIFQWIGVPLSSAQGPESEIQRRNARSWNLPEVKLCPQLWHLSGSHGASHGSNPFQVTVADMSPPDWGLLMGVDIVAEPMGQLINAAYDKVTRTGWHKAGRRVGPTSNYSIANLIECISEDKELANDFASDTRRAVRQRLNSYERTGLFSTAGTPLADVLKPGKVSVVLLAHVGEDLRTLVVFLLIRKLLEQRSAASEATKNALITGGTLQGPVVPKTWVILDEAQNIIPERTASFANRELTRFVREGRNFGLSMAISTQQPRAIDNRVMAQVDVLIAHTLTVAQDTQYVMSNLKASSPTGIQLGSKNLDMSEALRELDVGQCLVSSVDAPRSYFVEMRPRVTPHGGFEA